MTWEEIRTALVGLAAAAIATAVGKFFGIKIEGERRSQLTWAIEQGVAYAAELYRDRKATGAEKKAEAIATAKSLAPKAMKKASDETVSKLVDATVAKLRASLPHDSVYQALGDDIPVDVVNAPDAPGRPPLSERPTPLPPLRGPVGPGAKGGPTR